MMVVLALFASALLLVCDIFPHALSHISVSATPLLLIGTANLIFQALIRPKPLDLCKGLIVSTAFILWGIDQLLPGGWSATALGDVVITLYVIDLGWMLLDHLRQKQR
jgi:hypothetical protein